MDRVLVRTIVHVFAASPAELQQQFSTLFVRCAEATIRIYTRTIHPRHLCCTDTIPTYACCCSSNASNGF